MIKLKDINPKKYKKIFIVNDLGNPVKIQQPSFRELESLYYVLLSNLMRFNKHKKSLNLNYSKE